MSQDNRWQSLHAIVNQHAALLQVNSLQTIKKIAITRFIAETVFIFLLQYIGLMMSTLSHYPAPVWLATGAACGFIFLRGARVLLGIGLGSFFAYIFATLNFLLSCEYALVFMLQAGLLLWISYRFVCPTLIFYQKKIFLKFIFCSGILTFLMSLILLFLNSSNNSFQKLIYIWLANWSSILIISCGLLTWDTYFSAINKKKFLQFYFIYGLLAFIILLMIFNKPSLLTVILAVFLFSETFIISRYLGWSGVMAAVFLPALLFNLAAYLHAPIFSEITIPTIMILFFLQGLLLIETITGLWIAIKKY